MWVFFCFYVVYDYSYKSWLDFVCYIEKCEKNVRAESHSPLRKSLMAAVKTVATKYPL